MLEGKDSAKFIIFDPLPDALAKSQVPMVYLWLSPARGGFEVMYAGKGGLGVDRRLRQHMGGWRHSVPGKGNLARIRELLADGSRELFVYARASSSQCVLGFKEEVNMYSVEEEALQAAFSPPWNRAIAAGGLHRRRARSRAAAAA